MLLTDNRIKVNTQDMDGWTALMWACEYKFVDVVKSLLEKGADPHLRDRVCVTNTVRYIAYHCIPSSFIDYFLVIYSKSLVFCLLYVRDVHLKCWKHGNRDTELNMACTQ